MIPAWVAGLQDTTLLANFTAIAQSGTCTKAQVEAALRGLYVQNALTGQSVSLTQMADLYAIASHLGSLGASSYVQFITNALVGGNPANAKWTGGAAAATPLGDLGVGSSSTQLGELLGKWFDGADLPANFASVPLTPGQTGSLTAISFSYSTTAGALFAPAGPGMADVNQGRLGDCYLLASLAEVALQNKNAIENMIVDNGDGTYGVRFLVGGAARWVTVDNELPNGGALFNYGVNLWASLIEKAYAQAQAQGVITGVAFDAGNSYSSIGNGGAAMNCLAQITGASVNTQFFAGTSGWNETIRNASLVLTARASGLSTAFVLSSVAADLLLGNDVVVDSKTTAADALGRETLVAGHAFSVYGFDVGTGMLELRNPWGVHSGANYYDTLFEASVADLLAAGDEIDADNAGGATSVTGASVVAASGLQAMAPVAAFTVDDTAAHVQAGLPGLISDSKLTGLNVSGTAGADNLDLTGFNAPATVDMRGNADSALLTFTTNGVTGAPTLRLLLGSGYDSVTLGGGFDSVTYALGGPGGVETLANFNGARDALDITLNGGALMQTSVSGGDWITSTTDSAHGVFLSGVTSVQSVTTANGVAIVR